MAATPRRVHQLMAALSYGDAVSNDALALQGHLRAAGFDSEIFAEHAHPRMARHCRRLWEYARVSSPETVCLFHFAIGSGAGRFIFQSPDRLVTRYHNITPPEYLRPVPAPPGPPVPSGPAGAAGLRRRAPLSGSG